MSSRQLWKMNYLLNSFVVNLQVIKQNVTYDSIKFINSFINLEIEQIHVS